MAPWFKLRVRRVPGPSLPLTATVLLLLLYGLLLSSLSPKKNPPKNSHLFGGDYRLECIGDDSIEPSARYDAATNGDGCRFVPRL